MRTGPSWLIKVTQAQTEFVLTPPAKKITNSSRMAKLWLMKQVWVHVPLVSKHNPVFNVAVRTWMNQIWKKSCFQNRKQKCDHTQTGSKSCGELHQRITCIQLPRRRCSPALTFEKKQSQNTVCMTDRMLGICPLWELLWLARWFSKRLENVKQGSYSRLWHCLRITPTCAADLSKRCFY